MEVRVQETFLEEGAFKPRQRVSKISQRQTEICVEIKSVKPWSWETLVHLDSCKEFSLVGKEIRRREDRRG